MTAVKETVAQASGDDHDDLVMPAGTNARFALLIALAVATTVKMVLRTAFSVTGGGIDQCMLAAGIDTNRPGSDLNVLVSKMLQIAAYRNCEARFVQPPPWLLPVGWPALMLVAAVLVFHLDRWWKTHGFWAGPLAEFDKPVNGFVISDEVRKLAEEAGVRAGLTLVVDHRSQTRSASVLGSNNRPVLRLHLGLVTARLACASSGEDDPVFDAVIRHELAHISYGDVTAARGTMAVWRAFLAVALAPYLAILLILELHGTVLGLSGASAVDGRELTTTLGLVFLGYLARCDVLRNREIYADRKAVDDAERNGESRRYWDARKEENAGRRRTRLARFIRLWRSHPSMGFRAAALDDPVALFTIQAFPLFLAGAAAALIETDFQFATTEVYGQFSLRFATPWIGQAYGSLSAVLVTAIAGTAIWRAVAYGLRKGRRAPNGLIAGLWFGTGMLTGYLAAGQGTINQLVPSSPEMFLLPILVGAAFGWWTAQCAGAWLRNRRRGENPRLSMAIGLTGGFLIMAWWFTCWAGLQPYATGFGFSPSGLRRSLEYQYAGPAAHPVILTVISWILPPLNSLDYAPVSLLAGAALWVIPLLAWTLRSANGSPEGVSSLRQHLRWSLAGAVATWACVAGTQAFTHSAQPAHPALHGMQELTYVWLLAGAQLIPAAAVALITGLRGGRFGLLVTLAVTEATVLAGLAGTFILISADGCVRPLATMETSCSWRPGLMKWDYPTQVDMVVLLAALFAFAACALAAAGRTLWRTRKGAGEGQPEEEQPGNRNGNEGVPREDRVRGYRRGGAGAPPPPLAIAFSGIVIRFPQQISGNTAAQLSTAQTEFTMSSPPVVSPPLSPQDAGAEVRNWSELGGTALITRLRADTGEISLILPAVSAAMRGNSAAVSRLRPLRRVCADVVAVSQDARGYFTVPDKIARPWWSQFVTLARDGGSGCLTAVSAMEDYLRQLDGTRPVFSSMMDASLRQLDQAANTLGERIEARITAVEETGVLADSGTSLADSRPLNILPLPAGARPWSDNTGRLLGADAYVSAVYVQSAWKDMEHRFAQYGFVSGADEGWHAVDGSQQEISITRFSRVNGALSQANDLITTFEEESPRVRMLPDADADAGMIDPVLNKNGEAKVRMVARAGDYVIEVTGWSAAKPDPGAVKTLLMRQREILAATGAGRGNGAPDAGPLHVLALPAGARPLGARGGEPLDANAFVKAFYARSGWAGEERRFARYGFVSGTIRGWKNTNNRWEWIDIMRFSGASGAVSEMNDLTSSAESESPPARMLSDPADGGTGMVSPAPRKGWANAQTMARVGDYVIKVYEQTWATPYPAGAKALLLQQYEVLAGTASGRDTRAGSGPLGVLPVPAGASPGSVQAGESLGPAAFVRSFYKRNEHGWADEDRRFARYGFVSGTKRSWKNVDGRWERIDIMRFSGASGAVSQVNDLFSVSRAQRRPVQVISDAADGGVGTVSPVRDQAGFTQVRIAARIGDYVIQVTESVAGKPYPASAKALLLQQYEALQANGA